MFTQKNLFNSLLNHSQRFRFQPIGRELLRRSYDNFFLHYVKTLFTSTTHFVASLSIPQKVRSTAFCGRGGAPPNVSLEKILDLIKPPPQGMYQIWARSIWFGQETPAKIVTNSRFGHRNIIPLREIPLMLKPNFVFLSLSVYEISQDFCAAFWLAGKVFC